ncbi:MAG: chorismate mutase [Armatimonadota bacterium]
MHIRGIRGAATAEANTERAIVDATRGLLTELVRANQLEPDEVAAIYFTATPDLNAAFPAEAARQMGWDAVALLSSVEIDVPGALARCIRILLLWNTSRTQEEVVHVYLDEAQGLRPDRSEPRRYIAASGGAT